MKLLFVHGGEKLKEDDKGNYYTGGAYNQEVWNRYEVISDNITVVFRKDRKKYKEEEAKVKFEKFDKNKYKFVQVNDVTDSIKSFLNYKKRKENIKILENEIKKSDYVIARVPANISYKTIEICTKLEKPCLVEVVGCIFDALWNYNIKGKILSITTYLRMRKNVLNSKYVTYVSNNFLQKRYPSKGNKLACSDVVLWSIDESVLEKRLKKIKTKANSEKIIIGTTAAIDVKYKGQKYVIKAISKLNKIGYNFEYHLVGGGNSNYLKSFAEKYGVENNIKFIGTLSHDKIFEFLDNIDIYIQPSKQEGLCRALIEAMSRACPCIASDAGGNPELINKKYIFKKGKYKQISDILKNFTKEAMINQVTENFERAKEYDKKNLDEKRNKYYMKFIKENSKEK